MIGFSLPIRSRSELAAGPVVVLCALVLGIGVAHAPKLTASFALACLATAVVLLAPPRFLAAALVTGSIIVPSALFEAQLTGTSLGATPLAGQARLLLCLVAVAVVRMLIPGSEIHIPRLGLVIIAAFVAGILINVATAAVHGTYYSGLVSDLYRELSYPLAFLVGAVAGCEAARAGKRRQLYEAIAVVVIVAAASSVAYWGWATGRSPALPLLADLFGHVRALSNYPASRSTFPSMTGSSALESVSLATFTWLFLGLVLTAGQGDRTPGTLVEERR